MIGDPTTRPPGLVTQETTGAIWPTAWLSGGYLPISACFNGVTAFGHVRTEEQAAAYRLREQEERVQRENADRLAEQLLLLHLNDEQRATYARSEFFDVTSQSGKRYRLNRRHSMNVYGLRDDGREPNTMYCLYPKGDVPLADQLLAQKLLLEADEGRFLHVAIRSGPRA